MDIVHAASWHMWWRLRDQSSVRVRFTHEKYCVGIHLRGASVNCKSSRTWRRLLREGSTAQQHIRWAMGEGKISFWDNIWLGDASCIFVCLFPESIGHECVRDVLHDNVWSESSLHAPCARYGLPIDLINTMIQVPVRCGERDVMRWALMANGGIRYGNADPRSLFFSTFGILI